MFGLDCMPNAVRTVLVIIRGTDAGVKGRVDCARVVAAAAARRLGSAVFTEKCCFNKPTPLISPPHLYRVLCKQ